MHSKALARAQITFAAWWLCVNKFSKKTPHLNLTLQYISIRDKVNRMHIISRKRLLEFAKKHQNTSASLDAWYRIVKRSKIPNFSKLRKIFPSADKVDNLTVLNIGGNKIRLIAAVHYNTQCLYIRHVLTHKEYDKGKWKDL